VDSNSRSRSKKAVRKSRPIHLEQPHFREGARLRNRGPPRAAAGHDPPRGIRSALMQDCSKSSFGRLEDCPALKVLDWFQDRRLGFGTGTVDSHHPSPPSQHVSSGSSGARRSDRMDSEIASRERPAAMARSNASIAPGYMVNFASQPSTQPFHAADEVVETGRSYQSVNMMGPHREICPERYDPSRHE